MKKKICLMLAVMLLLLSACGGKPFAFDAEEKAWYRKGKNFDAPQRGAFSEEMP